jgi:alpha-glucosidase
MLGADVVIAPVLTQGARKRDLYLPAGRWRDYKTGALREGKRWLRDYPAPLDTLPLFIREGSEAGSAAPIQTTGSRRRVASSSN